jgi:hypothetical protein
VPFRIKVRSKNAQNLRKYVSVKKENRVAQRSFRPEYQVRKSGFLSFLKAASLERRAKKFFCSKMLKNFWTGWKPAFIGPHATARTVPVRNTHPAFFSRVVK